MRLNISLSSVAFITVLICSVCGLYAKEIIKADSADAFEKQVLDSRAVRLVCFYSSDSESCAELKKVLFQLSEDEKFYPQLVTVDIDVAKDVAEKLEIDSVPFFIFVKDGKPLAISKGFCTAGELKKILEDYLSVRVRKKKRRY